MSILIVLGVALEWRAHQVNEIKLGWLSPTAELVECREYEHIYIAASILDKSYNMGYVSNPDNALIYMGWVHITRGQVLDHDYHFYWNMNKFLTPEQIQYLKPYFEDENCPIDEIQRDIFFDRLELI